MVSGRSRTRYRSQMCQAKAALLIRGLSACGVLLPRSESPQIQGVHKLRR